MTTLIAKPWYRKHLGPFILIFSIVIVAFLIRIQGTERIPAGQFTENDGYFYYWQANLISENGHLPARDMRRWVPLGRDLGQTLNLYPYTLAYIYKFFIKKFFPRITQYQVNFYAPVFCFCLVLCGLCLFLYKTYGILFSAITGLFFTTLPGSIERSAAGFGDRDAWCLMVGLLAVLAYLSFIQAKERRSKLFWTFASSLTIIIGGLSWEGFGVFFIVILIVEFCRFISSQPEDKFGYYCLWTLTFIPALWIASPAYRVGYGFSKHLAAFILVPPIVLLCMRTARYCLYHYLLKKTRNSEKLRHHLRKITLCLIVICLISTIGYILMQHDTFDDTTVAISDSPLMQEMSELRAPRYRYWTARYGTIFVMGSLGAALTMWLLWKKQGYLLGTSLLLFSISVFLKDPFNKFWGEMIGNVFFGISTVMCLIALIYLVWSQGLRDTESLVMIAFIVWFVVWVALARDAKRYDFFIGVGLSYFTAHLITMLAQIFSQRIWQSEYVSNKFRTTFKETRLRLGTVFVLFTLLMFIPINKAHTYRSLYAANKMRKPVPGYSSTHTACLWMKTFLVPKYDKNKQIVVAADWALGSQLNVFADVSTITDQDTYIQNWVQLYYRHIHNARDEEEALSFLKTHQATHIMLSPKDTKKSFLRKSLSDAFIPIYPTKDFDKAKVKIWEIRYPSDIESNPKYLATKPEE